MERKEYTEDFIRLFINEDDLFDMKLKPITSIEKQFGKGSVMKLGEFKAHK